MLVIVSGVSLDGGVPDQELYLVTVPGHGCVAPRLRTGPLTATRAARTAQADHRRPVWSASLGRPLLRRSPQGDRGRHGGGCGGRCALGSAGRAVPGRPYRRGVRWVRDAAPAWPCPPAWWVGRSLATRPRAVRPREPPEDAPARGDQHRARIGVRQGPHSARCWPKPDDPRPCTPQTCDWRCRACRIHGRPFYSHGDLQYLEHGTGPLAAELHRLWRAKGTMKGGTARDAAAHDGDGWGALPRGAAGLAPRRPRARTVTELYYPGLQDPPPGHDGRNAGRGQ